jgi:hypothetical protein
LSCAIYRLFDVILVYSKTWSFRTKMTSTPRSSEQRPRFAAANDFTELIAQEVYVDVDRLRFLAFHGIPDDRDQSIRGSVWKILIPRLRSSLQVTIGDLREESSYASGMETVKLIRDALDAYQPEEHFFQRPGIRSRMEKVCVQYYSEHPTGMAARDPKILIHLFGPFVYTSRRSDSEGLFFTFMEMLELHNTFEVKEKSFRRFMSLFRSQLPQLCAHFEEEELDPRKWVSNPRIQIANIH